MVEKAIIYELAEGMGGEVALLPSSSRIVVHMMNVVGILDHGNKL